MKDIMLVTSLSLGVGRHLYLKELMDRKMWAAVQESTP